MTAPCRYLPGTACDRSACDRAESCRGPVDFDAPRETKRLIAETVRAIRETQPAAAVEAREEVTKMPASKRIGRCLKCGGDGKKLYGSDNECMGCLQSRVRGGKPPKPAKPAPAPAAPKPARPVPIAAPGATSGQGAPLSSSGGLLWLTLRVPLAPGATVHEIAAALAALPDNAVLVG